MALPSKRKKKLSLVRKREGIRGKDGMADYPYADHWTDNERVEQMFDDVQKGKGYLPQSVLHEDLDKGFIDFVEKNCQLNTNMLDQVTQETVIGKVPVFFFNIQKWKEFSKTWSFKDKGGTPTLPFITIVRKLDVSPSDEPTYYTIPDRKKFPYMYVPTWDGNQKGVDIYKVPQPVPIKMNYEVRLFTTKIRDLNKFNTTILTNFSSKQFYINVNGHYPELNLTSVEDESQIDSLEGRKFYVQPYNISLIGYLLNSDEFEVTAAINRVIQLSEVSGDGNIPARQRNNS